jgi:hypothetical protein
VVLGGWRVEDEKEAICGNDTKIQKDLVEVQIL